MNQETNVENDIAEKEEEYEGNDFHRQMPASVVRYMEANWHECRREWVRCWQQQNVTYGETTTNRLESINKRLKAVVNLQSPLPVFFKDVLSFIGCMREERDHAYINSTERIPVDGTKYSLPESQYREALTPFAFSFVKHQFDLSESVQTQFENGILVAQIDGKTEPVHENNCICLFFKCMNLPCKHMLAARRIKQSSMYSLVGIAARWLKQQVQENHRVFKIINVDDAHIKAVKSVDRPLSKKGKVSRAPLPTPTSSRISSRRTVVENEVIIEENEVVMGRNEVVMEENVSIVPVNEQNQPQEVTISNKTNHLAISKLKFPPKINACGRPKNISKKNFRFEKTAPENVSAIWKEDSSTKKKRTSHIAAVTLGIFCIAIGVPLWWKTTEVYRVSLPYSDIQHLSDKKIEYLIDVDVIWATNLKKDALFLTDLALHLNRILEVHQQHGSVLSSSFRVAVREGVKSELEMIHKVNKLADLENVLPSDNINKYNVIITEESKIIAQPILAPKNSIFLPYNSAGVDGLSGQIAHLLLEVIRESDVAKSLEAAQGLKLQRPDKDTMRSFRYHAGFDLTFTLMVPEPEQVNVGWNIEQGVEDYLSPLLQSLEPYTKFFVTSQVLYFISLGGKPKKKDDFYFYSEQDLPHVINPLETKLGSHASNSPGLNFIVCIPTRDRSPLYIVNSTGSPIVTNAFLSPRWGGIMTYNVDLQTSQTDPVDMDMHKVMEVFITQLRLLLNIQPQWLTKELVTLNTGSSELHQWELSGWLRCRCVENLVTATSTLQSLAKLLEEIGNIVINDEIGKEVEAAVAAIKESKFLFKNGKLKEAFLASKAAIEASELAFFHPSLLELLYFPEDQKFAIYIPLFLPISIPIVTSMLHAVKWFKKYSKVKRD
ncbi:hypothetical protein Btru_014016 [Bulinus truncatus]|nr:hypothetical protein Btru_014016 [Bulinus truncatus]